MLTEETKRRIQSCRDYLVGKLPMPTDQVELITFGLIYKFMDDLDEESVNLGGQRSFFTDELAPYRWRELLKQTLSADDRMKLFARGLELLGGADMEVERKVDGEVKKVRIVPAEHLPVMFRDVFRNSFLKFRDGRTLTLFLTELNGFAYSHSEELGNAFEFLLQSMGTQGENGQFRTPRHIIDFVVACLEPRPEEKILDPACGTGGFLVSAFKHILAAHTSPGSTVAGDRLKRAERQQLYGNLTGYDITDLMVKLSKVNLFLHGFPDPAVHIYDTLSNDARWSEKADLILANPPFMTPKGGVTPHTKFRIPAKKAEVLFTDYIAEHLSPDGRAGIIVPNGIVATTQNAYVKLRKFLVEDSLVAVISLPAGVFKPYSGVKTSILILDKKLARTAQEILFLKINADGFDLGDKRTPIEANDLPEAERLVKLWLAGKLEGGMESAVVWKTVEKSAVLESTSCGLQAEQLLGNGNSIETETSKVRLGNVCEAILTGPFGSSLHQSDYVSNGIPVINPQNIVNGRIVRDAEKTITAETRTRLSEFTVRENDIVIGRRGEMGRCAIVTADMNGWLCGTGSFVIRVNSSALASFVALAISSPQAKQFLEKNAVGVTLKNLNQQVLADLEIPLPPLEEQRRIVADIEGYKKVLDGARQILAGYRPSFDVDADWPTVALAELCDSITDGDHMPPPKSPNGVPFVTISNIDAQHRLDFSKTFFVPQSYYDGLSATRKPRRGDILYTVTGSYGIPVLIDFDDAFCFQRHIGLVRPSPKKVDGKFLYWTLASSFVMEQAHRLAVGAAQKTVSLNSLRSFDIPLPPLPEQERIVAELDAEAAQMETVRSLIPRFEAKIQRVLDRVWGTGEPL